LSHQLKVPSVASASGPAAAVARHAAAKLGGAAANRLGQPAVSGEILIGLILGPTLLNVIGCGVVAKICGFSKLETLRVAVGMLSRAERLS